ncbi:Glycosyltransferase Gtf1 [Grimontia celer]|uniref:Glycosyltransferase Gtf1 n=1 Tax=Grimontia celer TaxID=1796497 RepID=A0A128F0V6_9GAMM|nr:glycosyltransferase [Grimontia celer]CZF80175.1 Glycosyltransferase Gtf1 [Grimontia celer]
MKKILFLSAIDFKEKSIQVIRKTPEAYANKGWKVDYIVARDNVSTGNYFYESEIIPEGVNVHRLYWPLDKIRSSNKRAIALLFGKISSMVVVLKLFMSALKLSRKEDYDVVYGYEYQGVLAVNLLKIFLNKKTKIVSRFQGTFLNEMFENKQYLRVLFNIDHVLAIRSKSDVLIMTNDGTQGNKAVEKIKGSQEYSMHFWPNGVDLLPHSHSKNFFQEGRAPVFMSISRLVHWKKVERNIYIIKELVDLGFGNVKYKVIGDGEQSEYLKGLVKELKMESNINFVGALKHKDVIENLQQADFFLSMYDSSNVGNPLLEAIRAKRLIVTLANGDTSEWIKHKYNGLIYNPTSIDYKQIARDLASLIENESEYKKLISGVEETASSKLWTWEERLDKEVQIVD